MKSTCLAVAVAFAAGLLGACSLGQTAVVTNGEKPAQVVQVEGSDAKRVILTAEAAKRLGIKTEPVRRLGSGAQKTTIPVAALIYNTEGQAWIYTATEPMTYERRAVVVVRIEGDNAILQSGPDPGTLVVTVGAAELLGTEYGVEGE